MREVRAADVGTYSGVITQLRAALTQRSAGVLEWHRVSQGYLADIPEGKLLLAIFPEYASLTMIYESRVENGEGVPRTVERGRRVVGVGRPDRLQRIAFELATRGVPGGPTFTGEGWNWDRVVEDGSRRMAVPQGELRISRADAGTATLTHDDDSGVELLAIEGEAILERQALTWWQHRTERPLRVVVNGQVANLRSLEVAGLIGYHPVTDNSFVALARAGEEFALLFVEGCYARLAARITWDEAIAGKPFNVDELLVMMERSAANHGPAANAGAEVSPAAGAEVQARATPEPQASPVPGVPGPRASWPPGCTPMAEPHRRLCERYFKWLCGRLRGRGARKAREMVRLILAMLESCRSDITGTRQEVHRELERVLERALAGGDRNIRDALDLLVKHALFVEREEGTRCTVRFSQLHDPGSELMRRIAAEMAPATPPARPTAGVAEDRSAEAGEGASTGPEAEEEPRTHAPAAGDVGMVADAVDAVTALAVPGVVDDAPAAALSKASEVVADVPAAAVLASASDRIADDSVDTTAPAREQSNAGLPASVQVYEALVRKDPDPPAPTYPSAQRGAGRDAPIITTKGGKPKAPETPLLGFTRFVAGSGDRGDPALDPPSTSSHTRWDSEWATRRPKRSDQDSS